jgi:hypothetical protein
LDRSRAGFLMAGTAGRRRGSADHVDAIVRHPRRLNAADARGAQIKLIAIQAIADVRNWHQAALSGGVL